MKSQKKIFDLANYLPKLALGLALTLCFESRSSAGLVGIHQFSPQINVSDQVTDLLEKIRKENKNKQILGVFDWDNTLSEENGSNSARRGIKEVLDYFAKHDLKFVVLTNRLEGVGIKTPADSTPRFQSDAVKSSAKLVREMTTPRFTTDVEQNYSESEGDDESSVVHEEEITKVATKMKSELRLSLKLENGEKGPFESSSFFTAAKGADRVVQFPSPRSQTGRRQSVLATQNIIFAGGVDHSFKGKGLIEVLENPLALKLEFHPEVLIIFDDSMDDLSRIGVAFENRKEEVHLVHLQHPDSALRTRTGWARWKWNEFKAALKSLKPRSRRNSPSPSRNSSMRASPVESEQSESK